MHQTPQGREPGAVWVVLPTYNEADTIAELVPAVLESLPPKRQLLIVDDSSPDGTGELAERLAAERGEVSTLHRERKEGLGPAYIAGFRAALAEGAEVIVQMDADFSHDPSDLPRLLEAIGEADLAIGSRYVEGGGIADWGPGRRALSRWGSRYARVILGLGVHDLTGGFKAWRRTALEAIDFETVESRGYAFQIELTWRAIRAGFAVVEIPIVFRERRVGASKMSRGIFAEAVWRVPAMRLRGR